MFCWPTMRPESSGDVILSLFWSEKSKFCQALRSTTEGAENFPLSIVCRGQTKAMLLISNINYTYILNIIYMYVLIVYAILMSLISKK